MTVRYLENDAGNLSAGKIQPSLDTKALFPLHKDTHTLPAKRESQNQLSLHLQYQLSAVAGFRFAKSLYEYWKIQYSDTEYNSTASQRSILCSRS
jgi:hypothetical protein